MQIKISYSPVAFRLAKSQVYPLYFGYQQPLIQTKQRKGDEMKISLKRLNQGSYLYTHTNGVQYEIVNFSKQYGTASEWQIQLWETGECLDFTSTLREARELLAELPTN